MCKNCSVNVQILVLFCLIKSKVASKLVQFQHICANLTFMWHLFDLFLNITCILFMFLAFLLVVEFTYVE